MQDKVGYLFFCQLCGIPQRIPEYVLKTYLCSYQVKHYYCSNCSSENSIPEYLKKLKNEL